MKNKVLVLTLLSMLGGITYAMEEMPKVPNPPATGQLLEGLKTAAEKFDSSSNISQTADEIATTIANTKVKIEDKKVLIGDLLTKQTEERKTITESAAKIATYKKEIGILKNGLEGKLPWRLW